MVSFRLKKNISDHIFNNSTAGVLGFWGFGVLMTSVIDLQSEYMMSPCWGGRKLPAA